MSEQVDLHELHQTVLGHGNSVGASRVDEARQPCSRGQLLYRGCRLTDARRAAQIKPNGRNMRRCGLREDRVSGGVAVPLTMRLFPERSL